MSCIDKKTFGSSISYQRACYTLKCQKSKGFDESIKLLEETIDKVDKRHNVNMEESTMLACFSKIDIFESHTNNGETNLMIQNQSKTEIIEAFKSQCKELKEKLEAFKK